MMDPLVRALWKIADYPSGGLVEHGKHSGDRDSMIHTARSALMSYYGVATFRAAQACRDNPIRSDA